MSGRLLLCQIAIALLLTASAKAPASPLSHAKKGKKGVVETPAKKSAKSEHEKGRPDYKKDKKGKKETSERRSAQGRHERHAKEVASRSRKGKFGKEVERESAPPAVSEPVRVMPIVPDRIQVIESASSNPLPSTPTPVPPPMTVKPATPAILTPIRKIDVEIPTNRVIEIQQALSKRGFYLGDPSGVYDDATIDAMRRFQATSEIGITGYPTAQALKRLGLTNW
jgi:Putative peptidoglycan binding domain